MKTLGTKLDNDICQEFIDICNNGGQTVSEKIREMIKDEIEFCNNCQGLDKETLDEYRTVRKKIGSHDEGGITTNDDGTLNEVNFIWLTDEEKRKIDNETNEDSKPQSKIVDEPKPQSGILVEYIS